MSELTILRSTDVEEIIRTALLPYFTAYVRPLPAKFSTPSLLIQTVGGSELNKIDTFDLTLDARAKTPSAADELLRNAIGVLKEIAQQQTTPLRAITVNTAGSWGSDPVRPDLAMYTARIRAVVHQELTTINSK